MIRVSDKLVIGEKFIRIAGPCAIESREQLFKTVEAIGSQTDILRAGAYKPRTSPDSFQGLGVKGLKLLKEAGSKFNLPTITEVMDPRKVDLVAKYCDIIQIGARNMQNYPLLVEVGKSKKPVMLKRGLASTVDEWLSATEYITSSGNDKVFLCERGIRTYENRTRFTLDLAGAFKAKQISGIPVIIDPSHATGDKSLIGPMARAAKASGFDGIMIEVHYRPAEALCDKEQALSPKEYLKLVTDLTNI
jgi:3-deoxy-7-phosphoheptulonate synthase